MSYDLNAYNLIELINDFYKDPLNISTMQKISKTISFCFKSKNKVLIAGNGGSACDAMHFAEEFTGRFHKDRKALPVISLTDSSHITCVGNDYGFNEIFARGVEAYGQDNDLFIGISTSGNSQNIINAFEKAKKLGMVTFALLGKDGGKLKGQCDFELIVPGETTDRIQEVHMLILHSIIEEVERELFPELY